VYLYKYKVLLSLRIHYLPEPSINLEKKAYCKVFIRNYNLEYEIGDLLSFYGNNELLSFSLYQILLKILC